MSYYSEFLIQDPTVIRDFIREFPFAVVMVNGRDNDVPESVSVPVILSDNGGMEFHIACSNPAFKAFETAQKCKIVFHGPNAHISPSWYEARFKDKSRSHTAPTWNYALAEVTGALTSMTQAGTAEHLEKLVNIFEGNDQGRWKMEEIDRGFFQKLIPDIQGFFLQVKTMQGRFKLSQDQSLEDQGHIIRHLEVRNRGFDETLSIFMKIISRNRL